MPILEIIKYGNSTLAKRAEEIKTIDKEIEELAQSMVQTMHAAPGIGLAAPQVNVSKRLITADISVGERSEDLIILINPELVSQEGEIILEEGCLSVPDITEKVARPSHVVIKGLDLEGNERVIEAEGTLAKVFCHEIDHLNGKLFFENLSLLKRNLIKKKLKKRIQTGKIR
ncbi:MAG: peptide deformylase [Candidatus Aminicenantes bacterium]|nr:MAG: peptide deformylase [Candidatus Aminicenantes bacterium]